MNDEVVRGDFDDRVGSSNSLDNAANNREAHTCIWRYPASKSVRYYFQAKCYAFSRAY